jgi:thiol-disulfide isomerase/thioredoxin
MQTKRDCRRPWRLQAFQGILTRALSQVRTGGGPGPPAAHNQGFRYHHSHPRAHWYCEGVSSIVQPLDHFPMTRARTTSHRSTGLSILALQLFLLGVAAAEADVAVDVPDEFGLGERLALVAWLTDHHVAIVNPNDVPALRRIYVAKAHPDLIPKPESASIDQQRADLAAELYRKFGRNPPPGASVEDITALIASLTEHENEVMASDQAIAHANALANPRTSAPPPAPAAAPTRPAAPATPPAGAPAPKDNSRAAVGLAIGKPFPELSGRSIDGSSISLTDWKGKVVLVDAWATWCGPCMKEMPNVIAAYRAYHPLGLEILGISMDHDLAKLRAGLALHHIEWPQIMESFDAKGPLAAKLVITYIPTNFLIDANGTIIGIDLRGAALPAALEKLFGKVP